MVSAAPLRSSARSRLPGARLLGVLLPLLVSIAPAGSARAEGGAEPPPGGFVSGAVIDDRSAPIAGAQVIAVREGIPLAGLRAVSDAEGRFRVDGLTPGTTVVLLAFHPELGSALQRGVSVGDAKVVVRIVPLARILGSAVLPGGEPAEGLIVEARPRDVRLRARLESWRRRFPRDRFAYAGLPAGAYDVTILSSRWYAERRGIRLEGREAVDLGSVALRETAQVVGRVTTEKREPLAGARVRIADGARAFVDPGAAPRAEVASGPDGGFRFEGLRPGKLTLRVSLAGYVPKDVPVDAEPGATPLEAILERGSVVSVTLVRPKPGEIPALRVHLVSPSDGRLDQAVLSDRRGRVAFRGVAPGRYSVLAALLAPRGAAGPEGAIVGRREIEVPPGGAPVDVKLEVRP